MSGVVRCLVRRCTRDVRRRPEESVLCNEHGAEYEKWMCLSSADNIYVERWLAEVDARDGANDNVVTDPSLDEMAVAINMLGSIANAALAVYDAPSCPCCEKDGTNEAIRDAAWKTLGKALEPYREANCRKGFEKTPVGRSPCTLDNCGHMRQLDAIVGLLGMQRGTRSVLDELRARDNVRNGPPIDSGELLRVHMEAAQKPLFAIEEASACRRCGAAIMDGTACTDPESCAMRASCSIRARAREAERAAAEQRALRAAERFSDAIDRIRTHGTTAAGLAYEAAKAEVRATVAALRALGPER